MSAGTGDDNGFHLGTSPASVLLSDLREAASSGWALATDPAARLVDGSRLVYYSPEDGSGPLLVAVLSASQQWSPWLAVRVRAAWKDWGRTVRWADIVSRKEAAARARCTVKTFDEWRKLPAFPKPRKPGLWDWREIHHFLQERERYRNKKTGVMPEGR